MNRAFRRTKKKKTKTLKKYDKRNSLLAISRSTLFSEEEQATLSVEARLAWQLIKDGHGTPKHFDELCIATNVCGVLSESLGQPALDLCIDAKKALNRIRERYLEKGRLGPDADSLTAIPAVLDFYDECLKHHTPWQMTKAIREVIKRDREQNK